MTNVLLIYADDMRSDFLPYMPNVRRLLCREGTTFTQARCNVGLCQPSRAGLLYGQWATTSGFNSQTADSVTPGSGDPNPFDHGNGLARWMHDAGYRTGMFGKYMNASVATPAGGSSSWGWDVWRQLVGQAYETEQQRQYDFAVRDEVNVTIPGISADVSATEYLRGEVQSFIEASGAQPWFCYFTPTSPHLPFNAPPDDLFAWSHVRWRIVRESDAQVAKKPSWIGVGPGISAQQVAQFQAVARAQLRELVWLDQSIATIVETMDAEVLADTVIMFASDNGLNYGEHRNVKLGAAKNELYDVSLRVPCVIRGPGFEAGAKVDAPVSIGVDLTATICAIAGATPTCVAGSRRRLDGVDLAGTLTPGRALLAQRKGAALGGDWTLNPNDGDAIITPTRKLIRWVRPDGSPVDSDDQYELYDLVNDPDELNNLANEEDVGPLATQLGELIMASSTTRTVPCGP